jgi:hypothetical protein
VADWTPHDGKHITARPGALVDVLHRDGSVSLRREVPQQAWAWKHLGTPCDIVAWRSSETPDGVALPEGTSNE